MAVCVTKSNYSTVDWFREVQEGSKIVLEEYNEGGVLQTLHSWSQVITSSSAWLKDRRIPLDEKAVWYPFVHVPSLPEWEHAVVCSSGPAHMFMSAQGGRAAHLFAHIRGEGAGCYLHTQYAKALPDAGCQRADGIREWRKKWAAEVTGWGVALRWVLLKIDWLAFSLFLYSWVMAQQNGNYLSRATWGQEVRAWNEKRKSRSVTPALNSPLFLNCLALQCLCEKSLKNLACFLCPCCSYC